MLRELMSHTTLLHLPLLAMVIFLTIFLAVTVKTLRTRREVMDQLARLPFDDGEGEGTEESRHGR